MKLLYSADQIRERSAEVGAEISRDYDGKFPLLVGIMKGSIIFMADVLRGIKTDVAIDFMTLSSYKGGTTSGELTVVTELLDGNVKGRDVIVVEDIVDTGKTVGFVEEYLLEKKGATSVAVASLLYKPHGEKSAPRPKYLGFELPSEAFVVGWGLDFDEKMRNLPGVYELEKGEY